MTVTTATAVGKEAKVARGAHKDLIAVQNARAGAVREVRTTSYTMVQHYVWTYCLVTYVHLPALRQCG
jgi:hypothetical protein